ncbi:NADH:flavin oxidoreductase/NADH oxidase [Paracraurococcus ruber]|uniref:Oxidoreductase n=1 Tax=Paracraurococcus ruber TaxID=77675 RepID=A0ABS1D1E5_9PROT|nr:NADH:flavin oxidoreductase/NADH oxidase [Paracraurococcus ruber]MBK1660645.1 oxidoreductase [Paracraurococcus ruber]TDG26597.1 NADH:flavin oxidoreductase/NADH oxidase [Paracraurococcus ruber]
MSALLFAPYSMRDLRLANRIVVSPMAQYSATEAGHATDWHLMHVGNLCVSGAGLVIMEATAVEPRGRVSPRCLGLWTDAQAEALRPVVEFCRSNGQAALGLQLAHAGRKGSVGRPWEGQETVPPGQGGWQPVSSCDLAYPGRPVPHMLSVEEMAALRDAYVAAARRADALGFDLIELHAAHGYLLNSFLSPLANRRNDAYGGDLAGRMRYVLEVFAAIRAAWPAHKPLGVRISATDWADGGWDADDSVALARALRTQGCDYVTASSGGISAAQRIDVRPGYQLPFARRIQQEAGMPAMAVGLLHEPDLAEQALQDGAAELIALGRGMMWEPRWAWHAAEALGAVADFPPQYARSHPSMRFGDPGRAYLRRG